MKAVSSQAGFVLAPGGQRRLPMLLQLWKFTLNRNLPDYKPLSPSTCCYIQLIHDTGYTLLHNRIWLLMHEFTHCYLVYLILLYKNSPKYTLFRYSDRTAIFAT